MNNEIVFFNYRGLPSQAFEYIHYNGGLESEKDYPYHAKDGKCDFNVSEVAATVTSVMNFSQVHTYRSIYISILDTDRVLVSWESVS